MKYAFRGGGSVVLTKSDFLAGGGEGDVFVKGTKAYKVYHDPATCMPEGKIRELAAIQDKDVIRPQDVLLDSRGNPVGYSMRYIANANPLCTVFPKAYRARTGLDGQGVLRLVKMLQDRVQSVHDAGVLVVDLNEMNFLVSEDHQHLYGIDTDSYQTRSYRATVLMPSVRDWSVEPKDFSELSDWFSFGILAFQMFTTIHPFKGKHPTVKGLEERMKANISIFDPDVRVPPVAYPVDVIPTEYRNWMRSMFVDGHRSPPPGGNIAPIAYIIPSSRFTDSGNLVFNEIIEVAGAILGAASSGNVMVTWTKDTVYVGHRQAVQFQEHMPKGVVFTPVRNTPILVSMDGIRLSLTDLNSGKGIEVNINAEDATVSGSNVYARMNDKLVRVDINENPNKTYTSYKVVGSCMPRATRMWPGMASQNMLGSAYLTVFHSSDMNPTFRVPELDGHKIIDAAYQGGVAVLITHNKKGYHRFVVRMKPDFTGYDLGPFGIEDLNDPASAGFIVLDSGVVILHHEDKLFLFAAKPGSNSVREVDASALADARLFLNGGRAGALKGKSAYSIQMK